MKFRASVLICKPAVNFKQRLFVQPVYRVQKSNTLEFPQIFKSKTIFNLMGREPFLIGYRIHCIIILSVRKTVVFPGM